MRVAHPSFGSRMAHSLSEVLGASSLRPIMHVPRLQHAPHFLTPSARWHGPSHALQFRQRWERWTIEGTALGSGTHTAAALIGWSRCKEGRGNCLVPL